LPLSGVTIKLEQDGAIWATTDAQGDFYVEVPKTSRLIFEKSGYETVVSEEVLEGHTGWLIEMVDIMCVDVTCPEGMICLQGMCVPVYYSVSGSVVHSGNGLPLSGVTIKLEHDGAIMGNHRCPGRFLCRSAKNQSPDI
jgi:hypothetical protein